MDDAVLLKNGIRFGKGLQLVNILRDIPKDLRMGRCYLPRRQLEAAGLAPADLLTPNCEARFRPLYMQYLDLAEGHLAAGWAYTNSLPRKHFRLHLACAWPLLIGKKTLKGMRQQNVLDPAHRIKIKRSEVRHIMCLRRSSCTHGLRHWKAQFRRESNNLAAAANARG